MILLAKRGCVGNYKGCECFFKGFDWENEMLDKTLQKIKDLVGQADHLDPKQKNELLDLAVKLKSELAALEVTHPDQAKSIVGFGLSDANEVCGDAPGGDVGGRSGRRGTAPQRRSAAPQRLG